MGHWPQWRYQNNDGLRIAQGLTLDQVVHLSFQLRFPKHCKRAADGGIDCWGPILVLSFANGKSAEFLRIWNPKWQGNIWNVCSVKFWWSEYVYGYPSGAMMPEIPTLLKHDGRIFYMNQTHGEPAGYISAIQDVNTRMIMPSRLDSTTNSIMALIANHYSY